MSQKYQSTLSHACKHNTTYEKASRKLNYLLCCWAMCLKIEIMQFVATLKNNTEHPHIMYFGGAQLMFKKKKKRMLPKMFSLILYYFCILCLYIKSKRIKSASEWCDLFDFIFFVRLISGTVWKQCLYALHSHA